MSENKQSNDNQKADGNELVTSVCSHRVLDEYVDASDGGDSWSRKTTHPMVEYDEMCETFWVKLGDDTYAEFYGRYHMQKAFEVAEFLYDNK